MQIHSINYNVPLMDYVSTGFTTFAKSRKTRSPGEGR